MVLCPSTSLMTLSGTLWAISRLAALKVRAEESQHVGIDQRAPAAAGEDEAEFLPARACQETLLQLPAAVFAGRRARCRGSVWPALGRARGTRGAPPSPAPP